MVTHSAQTVLELIQAHPEVDDSVSLATNFREDLGLDSLMIAEIALEIEDRFHFRFDSADLRKIMTVADVIAITQERACE